MQARTPYECVCGVGNKHTTIGRINGAIALQLLGGHEVATLFHKQQHPSVPNENSANNGRANEGVPTPIRETEGVDKLEVVEILMCRPMC